jgi:6-phosphofructokinase 1
VELLMAGAKSKMVGMVADRIVDWEIGDVVTRKKEIDPELYRLAGILAI